MKMFKVYARSLNKNQVSQEVPVKESTTLLGALQWASGVNRGRIGEGDSTAMKSMNCTFPILVVIDGAQP